MNKGEIDMMIMSNEKRHQKTTIDSDIISDACETMIMTRQNDAKIVMMSEDVYNNLMENMYLTSSKNNLDWLIESQKQYEEGKTYTIDSAELTNNE